jgi:hypothetical protein
MTTQLLDQIDVLTKQARALLAPAVPIDTAAQLTAACVSGGHYTLAPGTYPVNGIVQKPLMLTGPRDAILTPLDVFEPALTIYSSHVTVKGITISGGPRTDRTAIVVGRWDATVASAQPSYVTLEDLAVEAGPSGGHRGIELHGSHLTVTRSRITGWYEIGRDSQGIFGNNGPGPYTITDNLIEASGENILFGGSDPRIAGMVPADLYIAGNTLRKPAAYGPIGASNKNAFELKNARRVMFTENLIENEIPVLSHDGLIQLTPRNQSGNAPWCVVEDVEVSKNVVRTVASGFAVNMLGTDNEPGKTSDRMKRIRITGNLFLTDKGFQVLAGIADQLAIDHNTLPVITHKLLSWSNAGGVLTILTPFLFTNNVAKAGTYAITGDGNQAFGLPSLTAFATVIWWQGNVIEDGRPWPWPAGQTVLALGGLAPLLNPVSYKILAGSAGY